MDDLSASAPPADDHHSQHSPEPPNHAPPFPTVSDLSVGFAKQKHAAPKSPPLAFEPTPNDSLAPLRNYSAQNSPRATMGRQSPPDAGAVRGLQAIVDQQANAIALLHEAFAAERQVWGLERERLFQRIGRLEGLLRAGETHSPAKSPITSPFNGLSNGAFASPLSQGAMAANRLPSIAEDENAAPLSQRREAAPKSICVPSSERRASLGSVSFAEFSPTQVKVEEIPASPPKPGMLTPPPLNNRLEAGHTPIRAPRPLTPPPPSTLGVPDSDAQGDTPTRDNTHTNALLARGTDAQSDDDDAALTGPLHMPELPHAPDETNFTFDMLSKRLQALETHSDDSASRPGVFKNPSPGLRSPLHENENDDEDEVFDFSPRTAARASESAAALELEESPMAPTSTRTQAQTEGEMGVSLSQQTSQEDKELHAGGIKLKKKASTNFGAPFGSLGSGFGSLRRPS